MVRIAGDDYPAEVVKSRFLKRNSAHIQYAGCRLPMVRMYESTDCERNILYFLVGLLKIRLKVCIKSGRNTQNPECRCIRDFYRFTFPEK